MKGNVLRTWRKAYDWLFGKFIECVVVHYNKGAYRKEGGTFKWSSAMKYTQESVMRRMFLIGIWTISGFVSVILSGARICKVYGKIIANCLMLMNRGAPPIFLLLGYHLVSIRNREQILPFNPGHCHSNITWESCPILTLFSKVRLPSITRKWSY